MSRSSKHERTRSPYHATKEINQNNKKISVLDFSDSGEDDNKLEKDLVTKKIENYGLKGKNINLQDKTNSVNKFTIPSNEKKIEYFNKYNIVPQIKPQSFQMEKVNFKNENLKYSETNIYNNSNGNYSKLYISKEQINQNQLLDIINNENNNDNNSSKINLSKENIGKLKKFANILDIKYKKFGMDTLKKYKNNYQNNDKLNQINEESNKTKMIKDLNKNKLTLKEGSINNPIEKKVKDTNNENSNKEIGEVKDGNNVVKTIITEKTKTTLKKKKNGKKKQKFIEKNIQISEEVEISEEEEFENENIKENEKELDEIFHNNGKNNGKGDNEYREKIITDN